MLNFIKNILNPSWQHSSLDKRIEAIKEIHDLKTLNEIVSFVIDEEKNGDSIKKFGKEHSKYISRFYNVVTRRYSYYNSRFLKIKDSINRKGLNELIKNHKCIEIKNAAINRIIELNENKPSKEEKLIIDYGILNKEDSKKYVDNCTRARGLINRYLNEYGKWRPSSPRPWGATIVYTGTDKYYRQFLNKNDIKNKIDKIYYKISQESKVELLTLDDFEKIIEEMIEENYKTERDFREGRGFYEPNS